MMIRRRLCLLLVYLQWLDCEGLVWPLLFWLMLIQLTRGLHCHPRRVDRRQSALPYSVHFLVNRADMAKMGILSTSCAPAPSGLR